MGEESTHIRGATINVDLTGSNEATPFDRLEERIDALIERYEQLLGEHKLCSEELAVREARILELEAQVEHSERKRSEVRSRLDALIEKLSRFS